MLLNKERLEEAARHILASYNARLVKLLMTEHEDKIEFVMTVDAVGGISPEHSQAAHHAMLDTIRQQGLLQGKKFSLEMRCLTLYDSSRGLRTAFTETFGGIGEQVGGTVAAVRAKINQWWEKFSKGMED